MMNGPSEEFGVAIVIHTGCNRNCGHCIREFVFGGSYSLSHDEVIEVFSELRQGLDREKTNIYFTGGEPTIWRSGGTGIMDILIECSENGFSPVLATNGDAFRNEEFLTHFIESYTQRGGVPLYVWVTADKWHGNLDLTNQTIPCVDDICRLLSKSEEASKRILLRIQSTVGITGYAAQLEVLYKYFKMGIPFRINPLVPWGKAKEMDDQCPSVHYSDSSRHRLGDYTPFLQLHCMGERVIERPSQIEALSGRVLLDQLQRCGRTPYLVQDGYYHCLRFLGNPWFKICDRGELTPMRIREFYDERPVLGTLRRWGPSHIFERYWRVHSDGAAFAERVRDSLYPIGFPGCSLCELLEREGILSRANSLLICKSVA